jgi:hypothetical protein
VEQRKIVDLDGVFVEAVITVREPVDTRLVAMGMQRQLGRAGGTAGVKTGRHALRMQLRIEGQDLGLAGQCSLEQPDLDAGFGRRRFLRRAIRGRDAQHRQGMRRQHLLEPLQMSSSAFGPSATISLALQALSSAAICAGASG